MKLHGPVAIVYAAALLGTVSAAIAGESQWIANAGGAWQNASNWSNNVPTSGDVAVFGIPSTLTVNSLLAADIGAIDVQRGHVALNLSDTTMRLSQSPSNVAMLNVGATDGSTASLDVTSGRIFSLWSNSNGGVTVGDTPGSRGDLRLIGNGTSFDSSQAQAATARIGFGDYGRLRLEQGATFTIYAGASATLIGQNGVVEVTGTGSRLLAGYNMSIDSGGILRIADGGDAYSAGPVVNNGVIEVSGASTNSGFWIGGGRGVLDVSDGAAWTGSVSTDILRVRGTGTSFNGVVSGRVNEFSDGAVANCFYIQGTTTVRGSGTLTTFGGVLGDLLIEDLARATVASVDFGSTLTVRNATLHGDSIQRVGNSSSINVGNAGIASGDQLIVQGERFGGPDDAQIAPARYSVRDGGFAVYSDVFLKEYGRLDVRDGGVFQATSLHVATAGEPDAIVEIGRGSRVSIPEIEIGARGELVGGGTIEGDVRSAGILTVLEPLSLFGNLSLESSSITRFAIGLGDEDLSSARLGVSNSATITGSLELLIEPDWTPSFGDKIVVLQSGTISGAFSSVYIPPLANGLWLEVSQTSTVLTATVVPSPGLPTVLCAMAVGTFATRRSRAKPSEVLVKPKSLSLA
jgi:hypothetical protein